MSKLAKKFIISILVGLLCLNAIFPIVSFAQNSENASNIGTPEDPLKGKFLSGILDGALGIILYPWKLLFVVPAAIIRVGMNSIAGGQDATLQNIFFNKIDAVNINIFEANNDITVSIAKFYVAFRNLAIVLSLAVLIYIGVRMAMNSTGNDKAKYKEMLKNWVVGFALIFILNYIIYFVIKANELLVASLDAGFATSNVMGELAGQIWAIPFTTSFSSIVMYLGLLLMTFVFLIAYIKRMVTVSFLIVISPLISVTYAIDKVGNNKSEILNTWLKEFLYNVLIQPFHCIIFSVFIGTAMNLIKSGSDFGAMMFAIILTFCIFMGQKLVREIFGFKNSKSFYEKAVNFAIISSMYGSVKNTINDAKGIKGARNDRTARKQEGDLKGIVGAEAVTGRDMVKYRMIAEENRDGYNVKEKSFEEESSPKSSAENTNISSKSKIDLNRPFKNAPRRVKRAARFYGRNLKKYTGYNTINNAIKNRKIAKVSQTKLNNRDYAIALSEMYRQYKNSAMSNIELADEYKRISAEDISKLNANELSYRLRMESLKEKFEMDDKQIRDAIIYGSSQNKRWRG